jgi:hypothetical protein
MSIKDTFKIWTNKEVVKAHLAYLWSGIMVGFWSGVELAVNLWLIVLSLGMTLGGCMLISMGTMIWLNMGFDHAAFVLLLGGLFWTGCGVFCVKMLIDICFDICVEKADIDEH